MMEIINCQQNSPEWVAIKLGKISASHFSEVLCKGNGRKLYMLRLAAERLTGLPQKGFYSKDMENGEDTEAQAREYYEQLNSCLVQQVGFCKLNDDIGVSPDGFVGEDGTLEIKCPLSTTHLARILADVVPAEYIPQIQGQLWVTGRQWCDFVSFDSRVKSNPFFCKRVFRDEKYIENLQSEVEIFAEQLADMIKQFTKTEF